MMETKDIYFKKILVAVDDSEDSIRAFRYAIHRALKDNLGLTMVSILEENEINVYQALTKDFVHSKREDLTKHLEEYREQALAAGVKDVDILVGSGNPGEEIINHVIPEVQPDLLVIGAKSKKGITKIFGSQAAYMAKNSPISVLVVR